MSILKFNKEKVESTKGMQSSEYDVLLSEFTEGGHTLYWDEGDVKRQKAALIAARLRLIGKGKVFHSGFDVVRQQSFVRLRPDGEVPDKTEEKEVVAELTDEEKEKAKAESLKELWGDEPTNEDPDRVF